jgi:predicted TIM-barrel fold metal-dependent hydrolase
MQAWSDADRRPSDVLRESFWFCMLDDPSSLELLDRIGLDHVLFETDYPHADSLWPHVQDSAEALLGHLPVESIRKITHENAASLFRHPLPSPTLP